MSITAHKLLFNSRTPLIHRLRVRQVLLDNNQPIYRHTRAFEGTLSGNEGITFRYDGTSWCLTTPDDGPEYINIHDFINKYKKSDKLRDLAFYKISGESWTSGEIARVKNFVGITGGALTPSDEKWIFDNKDNSLWMYHWDGQETQSNFKNCLQVAYEDVFPNIEGNSAATNTHGCPFKVGDRVRCIADPKTVRPLGSEWIVIKVDKDRVTYKNGHNCVWTNFELVGANAGNIANTESDSKCKSMLDRTMQKMHKRYLGV